MDVNGEGPAVAGDGPHEAVDYQTRKMLTKNKTDIEKSAKLIWISISIASLGFLLIIIAWVDLAM